MLCARLEHNVPLHRCNAYDFASGLAVQSKYNQVDSAIVNYHRETDKCIGELGVPVFEGDLLSCVDDRNASGCIMANELEQVNLDRTRVLLINFNIHSLPAHLEEFELLLSGLNLKPLQTFIGICETWLNQYNESLYVPDNFQIIANSRSDRPGRGVAILLPSNVEFILRNDLSDLFKDVAKCVIIQTYLSMESGRWRTLM